MNLITLQYPGVLITPMDSSILTLAHLLNVELDILFNPKVPYLFLEIDRETQSLIQISSDYSRKSDVEVSSKVFSEIIMDIASGIHVNDAMFKQNILFRY